MTATLWIRACNDQQTLQKDSARSFRRDCTDVTFLPESDGSNNGTSAGEARCGVDPPTLGQPHPMAAMAVLVAIPAAVVFYLVQKHLVSGLTAGGTKG